MSRASDLASPSATLAVLERFGLSPKKALGQNFLVSDQVVQRILALADVQPNERILEVGPGIGTLTSALLKRGAHVVAVERDPSLSDVLEHTLAEWEGRYRLVRKDALDLKVSDMGESAPLKLVANLPYAVAATIVLGYFQRFAFLKSATVMVQKEVAERMMARPGTKNYGAYTVKLSFYGKCEGSFLVTPGNFLPKPHVESMVIRLGRREADGEGALLSPEVREAACLMADAAFVSRRKTIANSCKAYFAGRGADGAATIEQLPVIFAAAGVDGRVRGETLRPETYLRLGQALLEHVVR